MRQGQASFWTAFPDRSLPTATRHTAPQPPPPHPPSQTSPGWISRLAKNTSFPCMINTTTIETIKMPTKRQSSQTIPPPPPPLQTTPERFLHRLGRFPACACACVGGWVRACVRACVRVCREYSPMLMSLPHTRWVFFVSIGLISFHQYVPVVTDELLRLRNPCLHDLPNNAPHQNQIYHNPAALCFALGKKKI